MKLSLERVFTDVTSSHANLLKMKESVYFRKELKSHRIGLAAVSLVWEYGILFKAKTIV